MDLAWPLQALQAGLGLNGLLLVVATLWAFVRSFRSGLSIFEKSFIWCAVLYFSAFLLVERLAPVFIFFGSVAVAYFGFQLANFFKGKVIRSIVLPAFLLFPAFTLFYSMGGMVQISLAALRGESTGKNHLDKNWDAARTQLFNWIREGTPDSASFVGEIGVSTQLLLYAGRPIVLNSQFENQKIRSRYLEYLQALYSENEIDLFNFFKKYKVDYVFINREWAIAQGRNTPQYLVGKSGQASLHLNISRLHFSPGNLDYFQTVFENDYYRVFAFDKNGKKLQETNCDRSYNKWWNLKNFSSDQETLLDSANDFAALQNLDQIFQKLPQRLGLVTTAIENGRKLKDPHAVPRENILSLQDRLALSRLELLVGGNFEVQGRKVQALEMAVNTRLAEVSPVSGKSVKDELLDILNGSPDSGHGILKSILPYECSPDEYSIVGQILVLLGEFATAGEFFGRGATAFPRPALTQDETGTRPTQVQERLWQKTVLYLMAGGEVKKGRNLARYCAMHVAPNSPRQQFFAKAGSIEAEE